MLEVWLTGFLALVNLALGALGGYVSLRPPEKQSHWKYFAAFVGLGLVGVALTIALAVFNGQDIDNIKGKLDSAQKELQDIQKPKRAHFAIVKPFFTDNNIRRKPVASINVYYRNDGQVTAEHLITYCNDFYILKYVPGIESGDQAFDMCMKRMKPVRESGGESLGPMSAPSFTSVYHAPLTEPEIGRLTTGESALFVVGQAQYTDGAGEHTANYCLWLQRLSQNPDLYTNPVWHWCDRHNDQN